jgi:hypothetical protein
MVNEDTKGSELAFLIEETGRGELRQQLAARAKDYLVGASQPGLANDLHESDLLIDLPDVQGIVAKTRLFYSDDQLGVKRYGDEYEARRWVEAYEFQHTLGYVYCPREYAVAVYFAFRDLAFERAGVTFKPESWSLAKLPAPQLDAFAQLLKRNGVATEGFVAPATMGDADRVRNTLPLKRELIKRY